MKFSIAMPCLNADRFIDAAIKSVAGQTYNDWELIVVDGGSSDGTVNIVRSWVEKNFNIKLITLPGSSIYEAIFAAFSVAKGKVLSWLNADDLYAHDALSILSPYFKSEKNHQWVTGLPTILDSNGDQCCVYPHVKRPRFFIRKGAFNPNFLNCIQAESTFFTAELFGRLSEEDKAEISSLKLAGDFLLWRKFAKFSSLYSLPHVVGGFRIHGENKSLRESAAYREEVASMGAWCFTPKTAHRIQQIYRFLTLTRGFAAAERKNRALNERLEIK